MKNRTIGLIVERFSNGGVEKVVTYLIPMFRAMGFRVVALTDEPAGDNEYCVEGEFLRVVIGRPGKNRCQIIEQSVRRLGIDVIVDHEYYLSPDDLRADLHAAQLAGAKFVVHHHNVFSERLLRDRQEHFFSSVLGVYNAADALIVLSRVNYAYFKAMGCRPYYIPNPVPEVETKNERVRNGNTIVWIGRFTQTKQPLEAVKIFSFVKQRRPQAVLHMFGSYDCDRESRQIATEIRHIINQSEELKQSVFLNGFNLNVIENLRRADILLLTSMFEGNPGVVIEAKACGVPVACYDLPYVESIRDRAGIVVLNQENKSIAADQIAEVLQDNQKWTSLSKTARLSYERMHACDLKQKYTEFFDALKGGVEQKSISAAEDIQIALATLSDHTAYAVRHIRTIPYLFRCLRRSAAIFLLRILHR